MSNEITTQAEPLDTEYARADLRFQVQGMIGLLFQHKKKAGKATLVSLAKRLGIDKAQISRWFNGDPNWQLNTIADLVEALDADVEFCLTDRQSGKVYSQHGISDHPERAHALWHHYAHSAFTHGRANAIFWQHSKEGLIESFDHYVTKPTSDGAGTQIAIKVSAG